MVKIVNAKILRDSVEERRMWTECFEQDIQTVEDVREANIKYSWLYADANVGKIESKINTEVREAVNEMKSD